MMWYFICLSIGACTGFVLCAMFTAGNRGDAFTTAAAANQRAESLERANGVLRRELAELRLSREIPRDHGYGQTDG